MNTKVLMIDVCRELSPLWNRLERKDRSLADQGRRAMQSMVLQYAEGLHAYAGNRKLKLLGARSAAHEARMCLELASACGLVEQRSFAAQSAALNRIAGILGSRFTGRFDGRCVHLR
jgi:four helix bundle protein